MYLPKLHQRSLTARCVWKGRLICASLVLSDTPSLCSLVSSLNRLMSTSDGSSTVLRFIDFFKILREHGDCVVLLVTHPGPNLLGRYLPPSKVNDLLLADMAPSRSTTIHGDSPMHGFEESDISDEMEPFDIMDLASFLEFAIKATLCLETLHKYVHF